MSALPVVRGRWFEIDVVEIFSDIYVEHPGAAERFREAIDRLVEDVGLFPKSGRIWRTSHEQLKEVRFRVVGRFRVLLFYRVEPERVFVMRALHSARGDLMGEVARVARV